MQEMIGLYSQKQNDINSSQKCEENLNRVGGAYRRVKLNFFYSQNSRCDFHNTHSQMQRVIF